MDEAIRRRCLRIAVFMLEQGATVREAAMEAPWAPRAALPAVQMASATARATWGGLCREVAALSR